MVAVIVVVVVVVVMMVKLIYTRERAQFIVFLIRRSTSIEIFRDRCRGYHVLCPVYIKNTSKYRVPSTEHRMRMIKYSKERRLRSVVRTCSGGYNSIAY